MKDLLLTYLFICIFLISFVCIRFIIDLAYEMYTIDMKLFDKAYIQLLFTNRNKLSYKLRDIKELSFMLLFGFFSIIVCIFLFMINV